MLLKTLKTRRKLADSIKFCMFAPVNSIDLDYIDILTVYVLVICILDRRGIITCFFLN